MKISYVIVIMISYYAIDAYSFTFLNNCSKIGLLSSKKLLANALVISSVCLSSIDLICMSPSVANAATTTTATSKIYKSGKNPDAPKDKDSKDGTKKDIKFLRCISNCKAKCQQPSEKLAKTDCVQDCQDQCCASYEQCSYKIKSTSMGNSI